MSQIQHWPTTGRISDTPGAFVRVIFNGKVVDMECADDGSGVCRLADFLSMVRNNIRCANAPLDRPCLNFDTYWDRESPQPP